MPTLTPEQLLLLSGEPPPAGVSVDAATLLLQSGSEPPPPAETVDAATLLLLAGRPPAAVPYVPFEVALSAFLAANVGIPAYHAAIPQKVRLPAIAWQEVDGDSGLNLAGPDGSTRRDVQIAVYDFNATPAACWSYGERIRAALVGPAGRRAFTGVFAHATRTDAEAGADGSGRSTHSFLREYLIVYFEPRG